jgi:hypothetical protein
MPMPCRKDVIFAAPANTSINSKEKANGRETSFLPKRMSFSSRASSLFKTTSTGESNLE